MSDYYVKYFPATVGGYGFGDEDRPEMWVVGSNWKNEFEPRCEHESEEDAERCARELNDAYRGTQRRIA